MVLGVPPDPKSLGCQAAKSLDHLYGEGKGEGARSRLSKRRPGSVGGTEQPVPTAAEWAEDLESLFGSDICQEVLGSSAASGNLGALTALDPDTVIPSMELLQQVLSLAGGTSESKTQRLRQIAKRITEQLAQKLAVRLRPHIHGLSIARPTRRRNRRLNLARTIRGNLANAVRREDGRTTIVAKDLIFHSASKREMDWHLTFVVDVSGSMTSSVVYSALCAAIFAELPALSIRFLAFSTQVVDLSGHVCDPLALLLEVQVGGGTHIGLGLRHARAGLRVPTRSMVILVTDFEEGVSTGEMIAETRALVESGVKCIGLAALDDQGVARFHQGCAQMMASAGMPIAAVSPEKLAQWVGDQIRGI
jgi:Mg-chelatase subunit ChlD